MFPQNWAYSDWVLNGALALNRPIKVNRKDCLPAFSLKTPMNYTFNGCRQSIRSETINQRQNAKMHTWTSLLTSLSTKDWRSGLSFSCSSIITMPTCDHEKIILRNSKE